MLPLIPLALAVVPELIKAIAGDRAGTVATQVAGIVQTVTGTTDPIEAQKKLAEDPALATTLRVRLAEMSATRPPQVESQSPAGNQTIRGGPWPPTLSIITTGLAKPSLLSLHC